jgi:hypothetical protein
MTDKDGKPQAKNRLKAELRRKEIGVDESYISVKTKLNRGWFSFAML